MMPPAVEDVVTPEREPGVYVRSNRSEQELDFLWDRDRRRGADHDRYHLGFFAGGFVVGSLLTFAGCLLFFTGGNPFQPPVQIQGPPVVEERVLSSQDMNNREASSSVGRQKKASSQAPAKASEPDKGIGLPFLGGAKQEAQKVEAAPPLEPKAKTYEVQSGDTLGSIAIRFYDSSHPDYIAKIQRANKLENADTLKLGQKLIIPPKSY